jgi:hypothetical protein
LLVLPGVVIHLGIKAASPFGVPITGKHSEEKQSFEPMCPAAISTNFVS